MLDRAEIARNITLTLGGLSAVVAGCQDQRPIVTPVRPQLPTVEPILIPKLPEILRGPRVWVEAACASSHEVTPGSNVSLPPHIDVQIETQNMPELDSKKGSNGEQRGYWIRLIEEASGKGFLLNFTDFLSAQRTRIGTFHGNFTSLRTPAGTKGQDVNWFKPNAEYLAEAFMGDYDSFKEPANQNIITRTTFATPDCDIPDLNSR